MNHHRLVFLLMLPSLGIAYPLDGQEESGIRRLEGYRLQQDQAGAPQLAAGQRWSIRDVRLALVDYDGPDFDDLPEDPGLAAAIASMLKRRDPSYAMVVVDLSDTDNIRWAGLRPDLKQNPGSVGKLVTMAGLFQALAEAFPDTDERARVLREAVTPAGDWVSNEIHMVPKWDDAGKRNRFSVVVPGDRFLLGEWLDHAISASANGAGAIVWREAMLIRHFGADYPVSAADSEAFFSSTPKAALAALARDVVTEPLRAAGIDTDNLQQGSFWTGASKRKVPGTISFGTPRELARMMFRIEQGRLVDRWSSLEMKRYLYLTKRRYRYSYAPELADSAVFFKSGSLYSCAPEEGFRCDKYMGNSRNLMNSVAAVEGPARGDPHYIVALMSNVLRFNSAWDHSRIAAAVHETIRTDQQQTLRESASEKEMSDAGKSE